MLALLLLLFLAVCVCVCELYPSQKQQLLLHTIGKVVWLNTLIEIKRKKTVKNSTTKENAALKIDPKIVSLLLPIFLCSFFFALLHLSLSFSCTLSLLISFSSLIRRCHLGFCLKSYNDQPKCVCKCMYKNHLFSFFFLP